MAYSGERFDPDQANALAHYDHHGRYQFVRRSFSGQRLLDVGCGLGVGAAALSSAFAEVLGIDQSADAVAEARARRATSTLTFETVDEYLGRARPAFDVVTCLEVIEHTTAQRELLELCRSAVRDEGAVIVSTPNKRWTTKRKIENPFHIKELERDEFFDLTRSVFPHVAEWSQVLLQGGAVMANVAGEPTSVSLSSPRTGSRLEPDDVTNFVAVCSMRPRPAAQAVAVMDAACSFQLELEGVIASNERLIDERDRLLRAQDAALTKLREELAESERHRAAAAEQVRRLRRLEDQPDSDVLPLRWKVADRANAALKATPVHGLLKGLLKGK